ncbi:MAG: branched-chain amino acid aminotransferase [Ruminococcaceae bacterium]|nr:branched-chain amino acid aminotransferase [Oscillospiraceae bacterium]
MEKITVELTKNPKQKPVGDLPFGKIFTDHMFVMEYEAGKGWFNPRIVPYGPFSMDPAGVVLHYGQEIFEGLKAYRSPNGEIRLFRPEQNYMRMNKSCERLSIPLLDVDFCVEATKQLVELDKDWVPSTPDSSLYIRPFIFANDVGLGVHAAKNYIFCIILAPSGPYYPEGLDPVKIMIEDEDVRAVRGGMGYAKTGGNYAASLRAGERALEKGYSQVLWLDGVERKYIEEVGAMNVFFKINGVIVTPVLQGSILDGITRKSCIQLLRHWGYTVEERLLSVDELMGAAADGTLEEAFGSGTAAVISPIGVLAYGDQVCQINNGDIGEVSQKLYDGLTAIQWGKAEDPFGWSVKVCD